VPAVYRMPQLLQQLRRAIVACGPGAIDELRKVLRGEHAKVEALMRAGAGKYCGDLGELPEPQCLAVSARDYYAAVLLGDLRAPQAVPELLAALDRPALPAYYIGDNPGSSQHVAAINALREIGSPDAAAKLRALWTRPTTPVLARAVAITAYSVVATDATAVDELGRIMADNAADDGVRQAAATAFARLAQGPKHIQLLLGLATKYLEASAKKRTEAKALEAGRDAAEAVFAKARETREAAKAKLAAVTADPNSTAAQIRAATAELAKLEQTWKATKQTHKDKVGSYQHVATAADAYLGFARMFQAHAARVEIAIRCHDDECLAASLKLTPDAAAQQIVAYVPDAPAWSEAHKLMLVEAAVDRAMIELAKRGTKASATTGALLDALKRDNRGTRTAIMQALPRLAVRPCPTCVTKLDATLATFAEDQKIDAEILRNFFRWAN
jgi:hypothetical protein